MDFKNEIIESEIENICLPKKSPNATPNEFQVKNGRMVGGITWKVSITSDSKGVDSIAVIRTEKYSAKDTDIKIISEYLDELKTTKLSRGDFCFNWHELLKEMMIEKAK